MTYGWDNAGNRTQAGAKTATYDARNRLTTDGTSTYTYTPRGTLARRPPAPNRAAHLRRLRPPDPAKATATYTYDALDRVATRNGTDVQLRRRRATNSLTDGTTTFSRGPADELCSPQLRHRRAPDPHRPTRRRDRRLRPRHSAPLSDSTAYDPFGKVTGTSGTERRIGYQGDYTDPDTDQVNMPPAGTTPAPAPSPAATTSALPTSPSSMANRYSYGAAAPTNYTDPTGHFPLGPNNPCAPAPTPEYWHSAGRAAAVAVAAAASA